MFYQEQAESETDNTQSEASQSQSSASSFSAFQLIANAFRRAFSVTNPSRSSSTAVAMYIKKSLSMNLVYEAAAGRIC